MRRTKGERCFRGHIISISGRTSRGECRECVRERDRNLTPVQRTARQVITHRWRRRKKLWAVAYKGGFCADCGYGFEEHSEIAQFDHIQERGIPNTTSLTRINKTQMKIELDKCDLVCANCHAIREYHRRNGEDHGEPRT